MLAYEKRLVGVWSGVWDAQVDVYDFKRLSKGSIRGPVTHLFFTSVKTCGKC